MLPIVALAAWYLWRIRGRADPPAVPHVLVVRQTVLALAVVAVLGYALNDSGIAIPAMMAVVFECVVVYVALAPPVNRASRVRAS